MVVRPANAPRPRADYRYLVDLPRGYADDPARRWPLILFLHHSDANGSDLNLVRTCALAGLIQQGKQVPAVVVSPQCPAGQSWSTPVLAHLLTEIETRYRIDPDRVYLTGVSAGGDETWDFALVHPDLLAAIVPMSGESDPRDAARLRNLPVWGFQGAKDASVPPGADGGHGRCGSAGGRPRASDRFIPISATIAGTALTRPTRSGLGFSRKNAASRKSSRPARRALEDFRACERNGLARTRSPFTGSLNPVGHHPRSRPIPEPPHSR